MLQLINKSECTGCYACFSVCPTGSISMLIDKEGFWYPLINQDACINCNKCVKSCPILKNNTVDNNPIAYAAYHKNEDIRMQSSSGGVFTAISEFVIRNDGVVCGASFNDAFNVVHRSIETIDDVRKIRGSKYVQSRICNVYKEVENLLELKRFVLFTGTPCQIAGLKSYLRNENDYLFTQDIICHGVPSPKVWQKYLAQHSLKDDIKSVSFRNKDTGWARFSMKVTSSGKEYRRDLSKDNFLKAFLSNLSLRPSCYHCHFKSLHRQSDITLADFWGIEVILPNMNDDKGISLVLINSEKGNQLFQEIKNELTCKPVNVSEATKYNKAATQSVPIPKKREYFFNYLDQIAFDRLVAQCTKVSLITCYGRLARRLGSKMKSIFFRRKPKGS